MHPIQERIGEQATNVREDREDNRCPPYPPDYWQALSQIAIEGQEGSFDKPNTGEEHVGPRPLVLGKLMCYRFNVRRWFRVEHVNILDKKGVRNKM